MNSSVFDRASSQPCDKRQRRQSPTAGSAFEADTYVGGLRRYEMLLDAVASPAHGDHDCLQDWYGGPYNPDDIDERFTKRAIAAIAIRRHAGKLAYEKNRAK